ncbi:smad nuclear interacting protein 1 [Rhizoctonia solani AG-1 IA]|uniref:Smad nuclear interacting protein 1 n=1 Tax=Thanatephorus cucumeris (strain AG1-IA) TaxID=983506 RepID=L8X9T4_THACA|nr:smad nuclear interacting protein 1 [Rhizoctonia solani AG-1 IA]
MPRRSLSPRRNSPPRRSRRSPDSDRNRDRDRERDKERNRDHREDKYSRDSRPRSSRDDRRDDYGRERDRDRGRDRDRRGRDNRRDDDDGRDSRRGERQPDSRPPRADSRSPAPPEEDKAKPNFGNSGLLAAVTNTVKHGDGTSTLLKYNEPPEARKPVENWRLYVFKGKEQVDLLHLHRQSAYLVGRDPKVLEHPSCSKQHAVIQFRQVHVKDEFGVAKAVIKPFVIDLESTNGTMVNDDTIPVSRFYELKPSDVVKFGESTREYVLLHDNAL